MIRIRYKDFSAGTHDKTWLHGRTECDARGVTVCLVPGLTAGQRSAVIRRLRQEASRGFGPALPLPQLLIALALDRIGTGTRVAGTVIRLHPAVTLVPSALVAAAMTVFVLASAGGAGPTGGLSRVVAVTDGHGRGAETPGARTAQATGSGGTGLGSGTQATGRHATGRTAAGRHVRYGGWPR